LFIARRTRAYLPAMYVGSVTLIAIASAWVLDRALGVDLGIDSWVSAVLMWPRSILVIAALYVVAAALYAYDRRKDALIPVVSKETSVRVGETSLAGESSG
jgi:uncharacterized membrane protein (DUF485 family)